MDGQVVRREDDELEKLLDQFVCVRAVQMYGVDLGLFQFQRQLTWAAMFLNGDGTIYGRYGSRGPRRGMKDNIEDLSIGGFRKALEGALEVHRGYPANKASLGGKRGPAPRAATPELLPAAPAEDAKPASPERRGCIHCHQVQDWELLSAWKAGESVPDELLWPYPMPDALGLALDVEERATVRKVEEGSPAGRAGFRPGDRILLLEGQPIISIADVQWVFHRAPEPSTIRAEVDRGGRKVQLALDLSKGWRRTGNFADTLSLGWITRMSFAGLRSEALPDEEKRRLGLSGNVLALRIVDLTPEFAKRRNNSARQIGLRKGDVIVEVDGLTAAMTESQFLGYLAQEKKPGQKVELTYLRGGESRKVRLQMP